MSAHPDLETLRAYASGTLSTRAAIDVDAHTRDCLECRGRLRAAADPATMRRVLLRVERSSGHLSYENLAALVDGKLETIQRSIAERHVHVCARCRREYVDMKNFAPALARVPRQKIEAANGVLDGLRRWLGTATAMRAVSAALVAAFAATLAISGRIGTDSSVNTNANVSYGEKTPGGSGRDAGLAATSALDHRVFQRLDRIAPEALTAYRSADFAALAQMLKLRADRGEGGALHALGLLYAEGRGVKEDRAEAIKLLTKASTKGEADAARNLAILQQLSTPGSYTR